MKHTWTSIPWRHCQSYTYPICPWDIPPPDLGCVISEPWIITVWAILRGDTNIASQVLDHTFRKRQILGPIGYSLQGQILRYHELGQVSHDLGGRCDLGNVMSGSSSLNVNTSMVAARGVRRPAMSLTERE